MTTTSPLAGEGVRPAVSAPRLTLPRGGSSGSSGGNQGGDGAGSPRRVLASLDPDQLDVVEHRQGAGPLLVVGGPGTGKTSVLVEATARRVERDGLAVESLLLLAPTRLAAAHLREALSRRLARSAREPLARTPYAYAYGLLRRARVLEGAVAPRLLSAAEQDRVLRDLLEGHELGEGNVPRWPEDLPAAVRTLEGFRDELRALIMRAVERGITPRELERLGRRYRHPAWVPAAAVLREYLDVTSLSSPGAFDPAAIVDSATALLESEPGLLEVERERVAFLAVDDAHELSAASYRLLDVLTGGRGELLLTGDPDAGTDTFRGAQPHALAATPTRYRRPDGAEGRTVLLRTVHRHGAELRAVVSRVVAGVGASGVVRHRTAAASEDAPAPSAPPEVALLPSPAQEAAFIAHRLREARLRDDISWSRMAVILRSARDTSVLRRALAAHGIPLGAAPTTSPLRDEPAVVPLRLALRCVVHPDEDDPDLAEALITSALGGADAIGLRALRRHLRQAAPDEDADLVLAKAVGGQVEDAALLAAWAEGPVAAPLRRVARVLSAGRSAADRSGADAHTVLWALWEASGLAGAWQAQSLSGGTRGTRADRDLDAVTALFATAARFVERSPHAGAEAFLAELEGHSVPADTLAERARAGGAVTVTTAHGAAGREWDVVVVAGVQEGVWPDLRPRSSLLGAQELADLVDGRLPAEGSARGPGRDAVRERRRTTLSDELKLFHVAVSRARSRLVVTAVRSDDLLPSTFLEAVRPPEAGTGKDEVARLTTVPRAMTLPALVAQLRSVVTDVEAPRARRVEAARGLARLAVAGVPGADPDAWYGLAGASSGDALRDPSATIRISPSKVEGYQRCPLRWLLEQSGGTRGSSVSQDLGSMIHAIAEAEPEGRIEELRRLLDDRWPELALPDGWPAEAMRRRAERMLEKFAEYARESRREGRQLVATEVAVSATLGRALVKGKIDRLERAGDGSYVVVDLKTGSGAPTRAELPQHAQLGVYQAAVEAGGCGEGRISGGAALVQLGGKTKSTSVQVQPALARAEDPDWARALVEATAEGMAGADFPATVNRMCRMCDLRRSCPAQVEGRRVAP